MSPRPRKLLGYRRLAGSGARGHCPPAPEITAASPVNVGMNSRSVTLLGRDFGDVDLTATAVLATRDCATASWSSASSVSCVGTPGKRDDFTAALTAALIVGTSSSLFSFDGTQAIRPRLASSRLPPTTP